MLQRASRLWLGFLLCLTTLSMPSGAANDPQPGLIVFAAVSTTNALQDVGAAFRRESGLPVHFMFAASSTLAKMIDAGVPSDVGVPADVFVSADAGWMDYLRAHNAIKPASVRSVVGNGLVLVAPAESAISLKIMPRFDLRAALNGGHLAIAEPDSVPAGRYARAALVTLGVWSDVADRLLPAENARAALAFVHRGDVPLGIVYRTDALVDHKVRVVDAFPADTHPPVIYYVAVTTVAAPGAQSFVDYLRGPAAAAVFKKFGFTPAP